MLDRRAAWKASNSSAPEILNWSYHEGAGPRERSGLRYAPDHLGSDTPHPVRLRSQDFGAGRPSFITNYIEAETHALLVQKLGRILAREWLLAGSLPIVRALPADEERARQIVVTHRDKDWSLCDAISFAVVERSRVRSAFSFDHHFRQFGRFEVLGSTPDGSHGAPASSTANESRPRGVGAAQLTFQAIGLSGS